MSEVAENYFKKLGSMLDTEMEAARLDMARRKAISFMNAYSIKGGRLKREISKEAAQKVYTEYLQNVPEWLTQENVSKIRRAIVADATYGEPRVGKDSSKQSRSSHVTVMLSNGSVLDVGDVDSPMYKRFLTFMKGFLK